MGIARFGSSPEPMQNYRIDVLRDGDKPVVATDANGDPTRTYRRLLPAETLIVDPTTGAITGKVGPNGVDTIRFRDDEGRIKPVCPFFEVWAQFVTDGDLLPLTQEHLAQLGLSPTDVRWSVAAANLKPFRRTGDPNDRVLAAMAPFADHDAKPLVGECANFKPGKSIKFGSVRYIQPTAEFPQIRARFTPAAGKVFGPRSADPLTNDDVYGGYTSEPSPVGGFRGAWDRYWIGKPGLPPVTAPGDIFQGEEVGDTKLSNGYFDDTCDGILSVSISLGGKSLEAHARFASAVPDFAPDSLPVRSIADDIEQMALGPDVPKPRSDLEKAELLADVQDILRRGMETVQQMNTVALNGDQDIADIAVNGNNMPGQQTGTGRAFEQIYDGGAPYLSAILAHAYQLQAMLDTGIENYEEAFPHTSRVRRPWQIGDLSTESRRLMPAMMRGNEGLELALTLRQVNKLGLTDPAFDANQGQETAAPAGSAAQPATMSATASPAADLAPPDPDAMRWRERSLPPQSQSDQNRSTRFRLMEKE